MYSAHGKHHSFIVYYCLLFFSPNTFKTDHVPHSDYQIVSQDFFMSADGFDNY